MKRKISALFAVVIIIGMVLSACSKSKESSDPTTGASASQQGNGTAASASAEPVEIDVFAVQENGIDLPTNGFTKLLEEKFNAKFKFQTVPSDGAKEKRQISLASGDYPDAYILTAYIDQFSQADVLKYGQQGVFVPLNDLIDKYAPNIKAVIKKDPTFKAFNTAPDGSIYGLAAYAECYHCSYPNKMWVNTKWLKKLNIEMPTTTEQFKKMLQAFKNDDPNGNGKKDELALSGSTEDYGVRLIPYFMNGFIYDDDRNYLNLTNGKVDTAANKPEWKEGLTFIKSLYDEGLIDPGAFTQNAEAYKKIGENADAQILGAAAGMHPAIFVNIDAGNKFSADYDAVPPLAGPHGSFATHDAGGISAGAKFVITNKASEEARIALIKMVDYMYTPEGQTNSASGLEGVTWRKPNPDEKALGKDVEAKFAYIPAKDGDAPSNSGWSGMGHFYMPKEYYDSFVSATDIYTPEGYVRRLNEATDLYLGHEPKELFPLWAVWIDPKEADEASILQTNIKNYVEQNALQFITGSKDLNKDWDSYVKGLEDLNVGRYLEILQKAYDATSK
ncbi:extracellular solute-binding protein [Cohnella silvisoli]|uniref:Extracellular solute-binding protein n=1 Tax=Cohnella silvisoli TaxID=2873699 RepID=A0ABV1KRY8_9BACL|nr:extracellular solute-binding protein [Cohnella silvisoli]MCD9021659.1 extracellular solute-binding protein [Cohnella silvisoli]